MITSFWKKKKMFSCSEWDAKAQKKMAKET